MAGESEETERSRDGVRDLENGGVKKVTQGITNAPFQQVRLMEDFQRITHHETDYSGTEGRRKKKKSGKEWGGGMWKCASGRLLWNSAKVRWCFRRTCLSLSLYSPNILLHRHSFSPKSEARTAVDWRLCNYMLMACWLAASLCGDIMLAHKVQCVDSTYQWAPVTEDFEHQRNGYLSICWQCDWNSLSYLISIRVRFSHQYDCTLAHYM